MKKYILLAVVDILCILYMVLGPVETNYVIGLLLVLLCFHIASIVREKKG